MADNDRDRPVQSLFDMPARGRPPFNRGMRSGGGPPPMIGRPFLNSMPNRGNMSLSGPRPLMPPSRSGFPRGPFQNFDPSPQFHDHEELDHNISPSGSPRQNAWQNGSSLRSNPPFWERAPPSFPQPVRPFGSGMNEEEMVDNQQEPSIKEINEEMGDNPDGSSRRIGMPSMDTIRPQSLNPLGIPPRRMMQPLFRGPPPFRPQMGDISATGAMDSFVGAPRSQGPFFNQITPSEDTSPVENSPSTSQPSAMSAPPTPLGARLPPAGPPYAPSALLGPPSGPPMGGHFDPPSRQPFSSPYGQPRMGFNPRGGGPPQGFGHRGPPFDQSHDSIHGHFGSSQGFNPRNSFMSSRGFHRPPFGGGHHSMMRNSFGGPTSMDSDHNIPSLMEGVHQQQSQFHIPPPDFQSDISKSDNLNDNLSPGDMLSNQSLPHTNDNSQNSVPSILPTPLSEQPSLSGMPGPGFHSRGGPYMHSQFNSSGHRFPPSHVNSLMSGNMRQQPNSEMFMPPPRPMPSSMLQMVGPGGGGGGNQMMMSEFGHQQPPHRPPMYPYNAAMLPPQPNQQQQNDIPGSNLMGALESAVAGGEVWVENPTNDNKVYYYNLQTRETRWDRPMGVKIISQAEMEQMTSGSTSRTGGMPAAPHSIPQIPMGSKPPHVAEWCEYQSPDNRFYYHNARTGETVWDKPFVLLDWEQKNNVPDIMNTPALAMPPKITTNPTAPVTIPESKVHPPGVSVTEVDNVTIKIDQHSSSSSDEAVAESDDDDSNDEDDDDQKSGNKSRPISSTPITGSPWCVVWTANGKVFYYNPSKKISVWDKPSELLGRVDVDELIEKPPTVLAGNEDSQPKKHKKSEPSDNEPPSKKSKSREFVDSDADENDKHGQNSSEEEKSTSTTSAAGAGAVHHPEKPARSVNNQGIDDAKEAEQHAAQMRAILPREVRISQFRELLREKQVSAYSTWKQELHKIVFDQRYLLLTSKERKDVFDLYIRERAEEERQEKKNKLRLIKEQFRELLKDANVTHKISFSDFSIRFGKDERFRAVEKTKEREQYFHEYIEDLIQKEKERRSRSKDELKVDFFALLKEVKHLSKKSHWSDIKKKIDHDSRYKAVESSSKREEWFKDFIHKLPSGSTNEDEIHERERKEREEASIRKREEEVKEALSSSLKKRDIEREAQQREEAHNTFQALLHDLIKDPTLTWKDAKRILEKDSRWEMISDVLERSERENVFKKHFSSLSDRSKEVFHKLLAENDEDISLDSSWKQARKFIKDDPRFEKFSSSDRKREAEYAKWQEKRLKVAKKALRELLMETKAITHKSKKLIASGESHMREILALIEKDKRYSNLAPFPEKREKVIEKYIDELNRRGPPPPPTASEPFRRK